MNLLRLKLRHEVIAVKQLVIYTFTLFSMTVIIFVLDYSMGMKPLDVMHRSFFSFFKYVDKIEYVITLFFLFLPFLSFAMSMWKNRKRASS
jgi:hypothetical protein